MKPYQLVFFYREYIEDGLLEKRHIYRFKTRLDRVYFIEVEEYKNHVYFAKFYCRIHKNLKDRYKIQLEDGDGFRIFSTCINLAAIILKEDALASFGFIGESSKGEEPQHTRRYKIYKTLSERYFSPKAFIHERDDYNSTYFIINRKNKIDPKLLERKFSEYYIR
ncbi:hypothetical protein APR41_11455 [Salegentibacter salinarum]|uniref:Uncharacterized protein n=1 Tax=Salegentibacter salinarum TaxID=447422 RepID=A0A2N0TMC4_9FLAO|nr:hypothetical protein [Salegentibacter salinarum]PKD15890.1 hypothetical protein APR41_11455 [Salegentibacter salinarum]SKB72054.1 hypothetical protein SAMN05660903_02218 [Salegentibacter salinarum]